MEKGILACLKEDISNVAKQDIIILGLQIGKACLTMFTGIGSILAMGNG